jgi:hypothetical protein
LQERDKGLEARERQLLPELRAWEAFDEGQGGMPASGDGERALLVFLEQAAPATIDDAYAIAASAQLRAWAVRVRDAGPDEPYPEAVVAKLTRSLEATREDVKLRVDTASRERNVLTHELFLRFPPSEAQVMPTRLGNTLRAAEEHPRTLYGLDLAVVWPRLQPLLPKEASDLAQNARVPLDLMITISWFSALFGLPLVAYGAIGADTSWLAIVLAGAGVLAVAYCAYRVAAVAALGYGETLKALVDLHRLKVFTALGIAVPTDRAAERRLWQDLSRALYRGDAIP